VAHRVGRLAPFLAATVIAAAAHELGHAAAAWILGIPAVPTPLKEYLLRDQVPWDAYRWIALGGVAASGLTVAAVLAWYARTEASARDLVLGGVLVMPFAFSVRYALAGRGHDGLEWQAAQAALGADPAGHLVDYVFLAACIVGLLLWVARRGAAGWVRAVGAMIVLQALGLALLILLQTANNWAFDRFFGNTEVVGVPTALTPEGRSR